MKEVDAVLSDTAVLHSEQFEDRNSSGGWTRTSDLDVMSVVR